MKEGPAIGKFFVKITTKGR